MSPTVVSGRRNPWNKGKLVGQKAPLKLRDVWAIRVRLELSDRKRELALFNLAIDSKLRRPGLGCGIGGALHRHAISLGPSEIDRAHCHERKGGKDDGEQQCTAAALCHDEAARKQTHPRMAARHRGIAAPIVPDA